MVPNATSSSSELLRLSLPGVNGLLSSNSPNPAKVGPIGEKSSISPPGVSMPKLIFGEAWNMGDFF